MNRIILPSAAQLMEAPKIPVPAAPSNPTPTVAAAAASGRTNHDEKITVYMSADELAALETMRLMLRTEKGLKADRGKIVRAMVSFGRQHQDEITEILRRM